MVWKLCQDEGLEKGLAQLTASDREEVKRFLEALEKDPHSPGEVVYSLRERLAGYNLKVLAGGRLGVIWLLDAGREEIYAVRVVDADSIAQISNEVGDTFAEDAKYYKENLSRFLAAYKGKYIALLNRQVVDSDTDFSQLAKRVYAKFGYRDIFMPKVTEKEEVVHIPTPFLERSSDGSI